MLSPDDIEEAAERIAKVYRGLETSLIAHLIDVMLENNIVAKSATDAMIIAQLDSPKIKEIIGASEEDLNEELQNTVNESLSKSARDDSKRIGVSLAAQSWRQQATKTFEGIAEIIARHNLGMEQGARDAFIDASVEAITLTNSGVITSEQALHRAVRKLAEKGIRTVTYVNPKTGVKTISNHVDVSVKRHIRTQIAQDAARVTEDIIDDYGCELVEVSSHANSRPSHAEWQGRCYGYKGEVTIDGTHYPDFVSSTGYGSVDGLLGANCRHSFGPYLHGTPHMYEPNPKHASGLDGEEVYALEQKQRAMERSIRASKRELDAAQKVYDADKSPANATELARAKQALADKQAKLRKFISETNSKSKTGNPVLYRRPDREWAGDMSKIATKQYIIRELRVGKTDSKQYVVNRKVVNSPHYIERFKFNGVPKRTAESLRVAAIEILKEHNGTPIESITAIDSITGKVICSTIEKPECNGKFGCSFSKEQMEKLNNYEGTYYTIHNHPGSSQPSVPDLIDNSKRSNCVGGLVAAYNGDVYFYQVDDEDFESYYEKTREKVISENPYVSDSDVIDNLVSKKIYSANEDKTLFTFYKNGGGRK